MASNFQQYTNGVTPVTGMAEAGANIGRNYQQGLGQMSTGLAEGIKAYQNNQALSQQADVEGHAVASQLAMYHQMLSSTPEYADLAGTLNEQVDTLQDLPTMSLPKKLAAVNAAKAALGQVGQNMQMKQMIDASRVNNALADPNSAAKGNNYLVSSILSDTSLDPHKTYSQNLDVLKANIQAARAKNPNIVLDDDASIISKWHDAISNKVNSSALPAEVKTSLLDQMAKAKEYNNGNGYQDDAGTTDYSKQSAGYNAFYNQTAIDTFNNKIKDTNNNANNVNSDTIDKWNQQLGMATDAIRTLNGTSQYGKPKPEEYTQKQIEKMAIDARENYYQFTGDFDKVQKDDGTTVWIKKGQLKPNELDLGGHEIEPDLGIKKNYINWYQQKKDEAISNIERINRTESAKTELSNIGSLLQQAQEKIDNGESIPRSWTTKAEDLIESGMLDKFNKFGLNELARVQLYAGRYKKITPEVAKQLLSEVNKNGAGELAMIGSSIIPNPSSVSFGIADKVRELTSSEENAISSAFDEWRSNDKLERAKNSGDAEYVKEELLKRKTILENQINTGKLFPNLADVQKQVQQSKDIQSQLNSVQNVQGDQIAIGSKTDVQPLSLDQQKTQVQDYMRQKFGYVPSAFNQQWTQMHPESQFRVIHNEAGSFYWDGKEFKPVPMKSPEEYAKYAGRIVGQQNQDGTMSPVHLGGGLYAQGTITGSEANVEKVQETLSRQGQAMDAAQKLMNMVDHWNGKSLSPSARADMEEAKATLEAAVRNGLFPSGRVAEWEQEILKNIVPNVTGIFTLDSSSRIKLNNIMEESKKIVSRTAALHGLHVQYSSVPQSYQDQYLQGIRNARLQNRVQNQQQYFQQ